MAVQVKFGQNELLDKKDQHRDWLLRQPGVRGAGIGEDREGRLVIAILSDHISERTKRAIEERLKDLPFVFEETGSVQLQKPRGAILDGKRAVGG